ncbi:putative NADPH-dependent methylglyoxal reductase GRE2 [Hypoxylon sp. NC1633]|nr:putative NADPH-dependent methylglyoxal reductase GRE2 [Hypoxylon sp. NC1633]
MATSHRTLLTGANGYLAQHVLSELLEAGHSQSTPPFDIVIHTASPFFLRPTDGNTFLEPAVKGTTEILQGITRVAPTVRRVVITSSFAAIGEMHKNPITNPARIFTSADWNGVTLEEALATQNPVVSYPASKTFAERAAWDFVKEANSNFELATVNPPGITGPFFDPSQIESLENLNQSTALIYNPFLRPDLKSSDPVPPTFIYIYIDVRDCARAHVLAATLPEAAGKRWFTLAGEVGNQEIANILREVLPEKRDVIPIGDPKNTQKPEGFYGGSAPEIKEVLGLTFRPLKETIGDVARQLVEIEKRLKVGSS